jgi:hypothetical protein
MANDVRTWRFNYGVDTGTGLLDYEYSGLAVDFTSTTYFNSSTWAMDDVIERNSNTYDLQSPHVFFTQSGTSPKYVKASSTTIGWSPHNLCLQSQTLATTWTKGASITITSNDAAAPDGTTTAEKLDYGATNQDFYQSITSTISGAIYTVSAYIKYSNLQWFRLNAGDLLGNNVKAWFDVQNGAVGSTATAGTGWTYVSHSISSVGNDWYRCALSFVAGATTISFMILTADADSSTTQPTGIAHVWGGQLNRGITATAYIATTTAAKIGLPISYGEGLLVEPAATNLYLRSQEADNASWVKTNSSIAANSTAAPDGSTTADTLTSTSTSNARYGMNVTGLTNDGTHTHSVYAKAGTASWLALVSQYAGDGSSTATWFNLGSGTVGTVQSQITSASITSVGDGWYRCSHTYTNGTGASTTHEIYVTDGDNTGNVTNGVNIYVWGAQLEAGAVATSYVPTVAASATRAADHVNVAVSTFPYSQSTQSAYGHFISRLINHTGSALRLVEIDDGTNNERIIVASDLTPNPDEGNLFIVDGGATQVSANAGQLSLAGNKIAAAWSLNNSGIVMDGSAETTDTSCTMPTVTTMRVGSDRTPAGPINGFLRNLVLVPRRMTEAEMQGKTA